MPRRRKRKPIAGIAGQKGNIMVEGSQYNITRQPDRINIHGTGETSNITMDGREHHIHIHQQPRPEPRRQQPLFSFDVMQENLVQRVDGVLAQHNVNFGGIQDPEYKSRWKAIGENLFHPVRGLIRGDWFGIHPFKLAGKATTRKEGRPGYIRDVKNAQAARALRGTQGLEAKFRQAQQDFRQEAQAALDGLRAAFQNGQVNIGNRNMHVQKFERAVKQAEASFLKKRREMLDEYSKEWNKIKRT